MNYVICPTCGELSATARAPEKYLYKESGIPNLWLQGGVTITSCKNCGDETVRIEQEAQLLQVVTMGVLMDPRPLTGFEMRFIRGACRMSQASLASELRLNRRESIAERERKENPNIGFAEEMLFRQLMLEHFSRQLDIEGNDFLAPQHRKELEEFRDFFLEFSKEFVEQFKRKPKRIASLSQRVWEVDRAA